MIFTVLECETFMIKSTLDLVNAEVSAATRGGSSGADQNVGKTGTCIQLHIALRIMPSSSLQNEFALRLCVICQYSIPPPPPPLTVEGIVKILNTKVTGLTCFNKPQAHTGVGGGWLGGGGCHI